MPIIRIQMPQDLVKRLDIFFGSDLRGQFRDRERIGGLLHGGDRPRLQIQNARSGFFPGFDPRLVIGVDIDQGSEQPDRPLVQRDQGPHNIGRHTRHRDRDGIPLIFLKRLPGAQQKPIEEIARGRALVDHNGLAFAVFEHLNERHKEVIDPFAQLLNVSVLVR